MENKESTLTPPVSADLRATWTQALKSFLLPLFIVLTFRWAAFEPYVIPSGSMIPNLLVHDYILVNKFAYGFRLPFTYNYIFNWAKPKRGDVIVFRNVGVDDYFLVKRVVGLPGDTVTYNTSGELSINNQIVKTEVPTQSEMESFLYKIPLVDQPSMIENFKFLIETFSDAQATQGKSAKHFILNSKADVSRLEQQTIQVPEGHYFMMGDNRDHSSDSRVWGLLPLRNILGRASLIWFSCEEDKANPQDFCDPRLLRFTRIMTRIN